MTDALRKTPLHDRHVAAGAKMVDFAGFEMPLQYEGILAEHRAVRTGVGVFDVSHMGEVDFLGPGAVDAVQHLITNDLRPLADLRALYTAVCRPDGGIVDDCIVYRLGEAHLRIVVNASNVAKDLAHFHEHAGARCEIRDRSDELALLAVQGPAAVATLDRLAGGGLAEVPSFGLARATIAGAELLAARTGYTGEDGFELFVAADDAGTVWDALAAAGVAPIGLGARDTLRLEARLCLYGNDIDETTNPIEAGLGWTVKLDKGPFVGAEAIAAVKAEGPRRRLVGFLVEGRGIARPGWEVLSGDDAVGRVTSGGPAPTVGGAVGMAYVPSELAAPDTRLTLAAGRKQLEAVVVKGPFYRRPR